MTIEALPVTSANILLSHWKNVSINMRPGYAIFCCASLLRKFIRYRKGCSNGGRDIKTSIEHARMADDFPADMFPEAEVPLEPQIKCVQREITFRRRVYARRISNGRMSEVFADQQIKLMEAVLKTLKELRNADL